MKKLALLFSFSFAFLLSGKAAAQDMPAGALVGLVNCSLNDGVTMAEAVAWARNQPRDGPQPVAEFYREAAAVGGFHDNYDFVIASYFNSYADIVAFNVALATSPPSSVPPSVRASDLYSCDQSTSRLVTSRQVDPNADPFNGDITIMVTRFCLLAEGNTLADAFDFVSGVSENFGDAGSNSLMQIWNRTYGPISGDLSNVGRGVVIATVPANFADWAARGDMGRDGFQALQGLDNPLEVCNFPAIWLTNAVYRAPAPQ